MNYSCGHEGEIPRNMGRGQARQRRLAAHFGRPCYKCRVQIAIDTHNTLTNTWADIESEAAHLHARIEKIRIDHGVHNRRPLHIVIDGYSNTEIGHGYSLDVALDCYQHSIDTFGADRVLLMIEDYNGQLSAYQG